ncbi:MAG: hypothetical protein ACOCVH_00955, partial [Verrucomicrobiota bacterium]
MIETMMPPDRTLKEEEILSLTIIIPIGACDAVATRQVRIQVAPGIKIMKKNPAILIMAILPRLAWPEF